jgi:plastocyanin
MKKVIGLFILMIACIAITGCTQQAVQGPVTTTPPTTVPTTAPTAELTVVPTSVPTSVPTTVITTALPTVTRTESPLNKIVTTVHIRNNAFVPQELTALPGTGITWINDDEVIHSLKMDEADARFNSGDIMPGAHWGYTFGTKEGNFSISDPYFPDMKGTIIVRQTASVIGNPQK